LFVALARRTLPALALAVFAALAVAASASAATVVNGDFETGDLSGWTQTSSPSSGANWSAYAGTTNPHHGHTIEAPPEGTWGAVSGQTGGSWTILYQDIVLEAGQTHMLSLQAYYTNENADLISPDTLALDVPNQQYRIDVLPTTAPVDSVDPADILTTIFRTQPGDANVRGSFPVSSDLSAFAGQTVRLRFAQVSTQFFFSASVDDVRIASGPGVGTSPGTLAFGQQRIDDGPAVSQTSRLTNHSTDPVTLSGLSLSGDSTQFEHLTGEAGDCTATTVLAGGEGCDLRVRFDPTATGAKTATLTIATSAGDRTVALTGTGTQPESTLTPDTLAYGSHEIDDGPTVSQTSTVTNSGTEPVVLSGLTLSADATQFERLTGAIGDCTASTTLAAGETCDVRVRFDPSSDGSKAATLTVTSNTPDHTVAVTGTGIHTELTPGPDTLRFGSLDIDDGPTVSRTSTVTNNGTEPVTLSGLTLSADVTQFERLTGDAGDCTATTTLAAGDACDVRVRFDPGSTGAKTATLTIASSAADRMVALTGTGVRVDTDGDGISDRFDADDDGDGTPDSADAFPLNRAESIDTDGDGIGNNADTDDDGDGTPDSADAFPLDSARQEADRPSLPAAVSPWMLDRVAKAKVIQRTTGLRVRTGYRAVCPAGGPACSGRLTLKILRRSPSSGDLRRVFLTAKAPLTTLPAGTQRRISFTLKPRGARLLRKAGSLRATLRGSVRAGAGRPVVRTATLRISAPRQP
jgi:hypothetical protein